MKKKWIWTISILLTAVILAVLAAVYLPVWKQMLYEKKIENYYTLFRDEVNAANHYAEDVSIIELIATPEKYDGKLVRVIGVGLIETDHGDFEDSLYLNKEDYEIHTGNSLRLEMGIRAISREDASIFNGKYVIVEGFFKQTDEPLHSGLLTNVSRYELWKPAGKTD